MRLTDQVAQNLRPRGRNKSGVYWDDSLPILGVYTTIEGMNMWVYRNGVEDKWVRMAPVVAYGYDEARRLALEKVRNDISDDPEDPRLDFLVQQYYESREKSVKPVTLKRYKWLVGILEEHMPKSARVSQVTRSWAHDLYTRMKAARTDNAAADALYFVQCSVEWEGFPWPKGARYKVPRKRKPIVLTWDQWQMLWDAFEEYPHVHSRKTRRTSDMRKSVFFQVLMLHPLRPWSELLPRRFEDIEEIPLWGGKVGHVINLPTRKSERGHDTEMRILLDRVAYEKIMALPVRQHGPIFRAPGRDSVPFGRTPLNRYWEYVTKQVGMKKLQPKDLRHTAATRLAEARIDPSISAMLSGATAETLRRVYQKPTLEAAFEAQESLGYRQRIGGTV